MVVTGFHLPEETSSASLQWAELRLEGVNAGDAMARPQRGAQEGGLWVGTLEGPHAMVSHPLGRGQPRGRSDCHAFRDSLA